MSVYDLFEKGRLNINSKGKKLMMLPLCYCRNNGLMTFSFPVGV
jgi:hypothetical protein